MKKIGNVYYYNATYSMVGNYAYFIYAIDTTGNENTSAIKTFSVFIEYTLTTHVSPSNAGYITLNPSGGKYDAGTVVTVTAHANSGYAFDHWSGDASGSNPTIGITMDGNKSITAYFVAVPPPPQNQPPSIEITLPQNNATVNGTITIKGIASDDEQVVKVEIRIDDGTWIQATGTTTWSYSIDTTTLSNGLHKIETRAYDGSLYSNISYISINVFNNHKPIVAITEPENGSAVKGSIIIKGKAWDEDGNESIVKVEIRMDNGTWHIVNGTNSWNYSIDTKELKNGMHVVETRCYDGHDYSNVASIHIEVKNKNKTPAFEIIAFITAIAITFVYHKRKR